MGDCHIGSPQCDYEFLEKWKEVFKGTKSEKIIYLQGDLIDCARKSLGSSAYEQTMSVDEQINYVLKFLKPIRKHIQGMVGGNHEARLKKEFDLDVNKLIADNLDIEYSINHYHEYLINDESFKVFTTHGSKVSSQPHLMLGTALRSTKHIDADLVLYAHCHQGNSIKTYSMDYNGYKERTTVLTGSFLSYKGSYAQEMGLSPTPCAFPVISIGCNHDTDVKYYINKEV